jgi:hypothetical protein
MGLKCSLLGHSFEPADIEREREEQGSEVVTTVRELERCHRCGKERVVSESTEVTAVVDAGDVAVDDDNGHGVEAGTEDAAADAPTAGGEDVTADAPTAGAEDTSADTPTAGAEEAPEGGGLDGMIDRSEAVEDDPGHADETVGDPAGSAADDTEAADLEDRDPASEDTEILTDDDTDRAPGEWPEEAYDEGYDSDDVESAVEHVSDEEELSGITVPEGQIVCPNCSFEVGAESGYRGGDPCPECGEWLASERNR